MSDMSAIIKYIEENSKIVSVIGDCPNVEFPTSGGKIFWKDKKINKGWRLQTNDFTGVSRIIDENNVRKAWGSYVIMNEKFKRLTRSEFLEPGDIVGISRKKALNLYEHYGVYIGNGKIIHYAGSETDFGGKITVRIDTLQSFLKNDKDYFVLYFDEDCAVLHKIQVRTNFNLSDVNDSTYVKLTKKRGYKIYTPEETVKRALSRLGEDKYSLFLNNCEHFAIWCKVGVAESFQINKTMEMLLDTQLPKGDI